MLYILYCEDRSDGAAELRAKLRDAHLGYLEKHTSIIVLGGAMLPEEGDKRIGSVLIINVPNRQAAENFSGSEPYRQAGLYKSVRIERMRRAQWNPAAAPATADGN